MGEKPILSKPPHLRPVRCCDTCTFVEVHYEGERSCWRFAKRYAPKPKDPDERDNVAAFDVQQSDICDDYAPNEHMAKTEKKARFKR